MSTLNGYKVRCAVANAAIVPAGSPGSISVFVTTTSTARIDICRALRAIGQSSVEQQLPCITSVDSGNTVVHSGKMVQIGRRRSLRARRNLRSPGTETPPRYQPAASQPTSSSAISSNLCQRAINRRTFSLLCFASTSSLTSAAAGDEERYGLLQNKRERGQARAAADLSHPIARRASPCREFPAARLRRTPAPGSAIR